MLFHFVLLTRLFFAGPKDVKDIYYVLKDNAAQLTEGNDTISYQVLVSPVHDEGILKLASFPAY